MGGALRQIRALYATGPTWGASDARLIERFLARGEDAEEAFTALVRRHGPMVLGVCRRRLPGSPDAEDAFQAVFLVLARRAGSIRRAEGLRAWLHGVAVRTAREARRGAARRRARERAAMAHAQAVAEPDHGLAERLGLLDEELGRLPERYRSPLVLCELEGASRREAAERLGLAEGTLSSRLARGRVLLRDRLVRRGVALGAGSLAALLPGPADAAIPGPLAESTARLAVSITAGGSAAGMVPAAVASLAGRMLTMTARASLRTALAALALVAAGITLAWAAGPKRDEPKAEAPAAVTAKPEGKAAAAVEAPKPTGIDVRGTVVDEAGRPVAGAEVRVDAFADQEARGVTGADGSFSIASRRRKPDGMSILARSPGGDRRGAFRYSFNMTREQADDPARLVLKPARGVAVRVADAKGLPVPGAAVVIAGTFQVADESTTDADGRARLSVPADARIEWVIALKPGVGFDYAECGKFDGVPAEELPDSVALALDGTRSARIKAVDRDGTPLAGIAFSPWLLRKPGKRGIVNLPASRAFAATTGPDGFAAFDWLPANEQAITFWPRTEGYTHRRAELAAGGRSTITARLIRAETIRGRVVRPDGAPAAGIRLVALGSGNGRDNGQAQGRTAADGSYELEVPPGEAYSVAVDDADWAAPARLDVVVRAGKPAVGVDFRLTRGTLLRGTVTVAPTGRPVAGEFIRLAEDCGRAPADLGEEGDHFAREVQRQVGATTDEQGRYSIRLGPGTYTLCGPPRTEEQKLTVKDEPEVVRDFRMPRPGKGPLSGRVVTATDPTRGVAGATVTYLSANNRSYPVAVTADAEGRFRVERDLDKTTLCAKSPDGSLGAIVEIGAEDPKVVIPVAPTAAATGLLLDEKGEAAANERVEWGRTVRVGPDEDSPSMHCFGTRVVTDAMGRFTLPSLVVGQEYSIATLRKNHYALAGVVRPDSPAPIDLGTLRAGSYRSPNAEDSSSFRKDAPDAGAPAPPIEATTLDGKPLTLADFKGKYVLLDFWATWCGPCLGEIPQLQAVHEAFGKDDRFAILSLSVDEGIDEPKAFQEARKLPWAQGFLGVGIHGPQPGRFGVKAIPAFVLVGPDGKIVARGMRGEEIKKAVAKALGTP